MIARSTGKATGLTEDAALDFMRSLEVAAITNQKKFFCPALGKSFARVDAEKEGLAAKAFVDLDHRRK